MNTFLWHLVLSVTWAFAVGELSLTNLVFGFALAYIPLWLGRGIFGSGEYCGRLPRLLIFMLYFLWKVVQANLRVARDVVTPRYRMRAGIIALPLDAETDEEITLFACLLTLTPGTLSLGLSEDRRVMYVHSMYIADVAQEKQALKDGLERRLLEVMR